MIQIARNLALLCRTRKGTRVRRRFRINNQGILPIVEKVASALKNSYGEIILKYEPEALKQFLKEFYATVRQ